MINVTKVTKMTWKNNWMTEITFGNSMFHKYIFIFYSKSIGEVWMHAWRRGPCFCHLGPEIWQLCQILHQQASLYPTPGPAWRTVLWGLAAEIWAWTPDRRVPDQARSTYHQVPTTAQRFAQLQVKYPKKCQKNTKICQKCQKSQKCKKMPKM